MAFTHHIQIGALAGTLALVVLGVATFFGTPARAQGTYPIAVTVDGSQVTFDRAQPIELHGSVLVPLRGVFESLGASVQYDPTAQIVTAVKGDRTVVVPIGSATATIDGQPQQLSQPAQIVSGSTMVPLRFVAEALGEYVEWSDQTHMVSITTIQPSLNVAAVPPPGLASSDQPPSLPRYFRGADQNILVGVVRQVMNDSDPRQIIVRVDGEDREIAIMDDATILRGRVGRDGEQVALSDIEPGDRVVIHRDDRGSAVRIASSFGLVYGTVSGVATKADGSRVVVLDDGQNVDLAPSARVLRDGVTIAAVDLNTGDHVTILTDPDDGSAYKITVNPPIFAHRR